MDVENGMILVNSRNEISTPIKNLFKNLHILYDRNSKLYNPTNEIYDEAKKNEIFKKYMNEILLRMSQYSKLTYRQEGHIDENIFNIPIINGNNMLMLFCSSDKIDEELCIYIIKNYGNLFDLEFMNGDKDNALLLSIQTNKFEVARLLIDFNIDSEEMNYSGNTALDYMLAKIKYDENKNLITETTISIIARLLKVHLDNLDYHDIDNRRQHKNDKTQGYINYFCKYREFWGPLLEKYFIIDERIDFKKSENGYTNKICDEVLKANPINMEADVNDVQSIRKRGSTGTIKEDTRLPRASYPMPNIHIDDEGNTYYKQQFILEKDIADIGFFLGEDEQQEPPEAIVHANDTFWPQLIPKKLGGKKRKSKSKKSKKSKKPTKSTKSHRIRNKTNKKV